MRTCVLLAGSDLNALVRTSVTLPHDWTQELSESRNPVADLLSRQRLTADAAIAFLSGRENVIDLRDVMLIHTETRFLFLTASYPPSAAVARVIARGHGVVLSHDESPLVVAATLIAMLVGTDIALP